MSIWTVVVADGSRARLLSAEMPLGASATELKERQVLLNPEANLPGKDVFSDLKSGRDRAPPSGKAHGFDDHRQRHRDEVEKRFAHQIARATAKLVSELASPSVILVVEPRLLGMLRPALDAALDESVRRVELAEDLSWHALSHIRELLEHQGILPKSQPSPLAWHPRAQPPPRTPGKLAAAKIDTRREQARPRRVRTKASPVR